MGCVTIIIEDESVDVSEWVDLQKERDRLLKLSLEKVREREKCY